MSASIHCIPIHRYPVTQTGAYFNTVTQRYQFWLFLNGKTALCGECQKDLPQEVIRKWFFTTGDGLMQRIAAQVAKEIGQQGHEAVLASLKTLLAGA